MRYKQKLRKRRGWGATFCIKEKGQSELEMKGNKREIKKNTLNPMYFFF
jgi:hypothetical protein